MTELERVWPPETFFTRHTRSSHLSVQGLIDVSSGSAPSSALLPVVQAPGEHVFAAPLGTPVLVPKLWALLPAEGRLAGVAVGLRVG